ncbi:MAG TPA: hypothetical protein VFA09_10360 [Ktedonobacteraceae bacterium]|nr:hypothetical protein [Ktedonobacteraceae bacterium]
MVITVHHRLSIVMNCYHYWLPIVMRTVHHWRRREGLIGGPINRRWARYACPPDRTARPLRAVGTEQAGREEKEV